MESKPRMLISDTVRLTREIEEYISSVISGVSRSKVSFTSNSTDGRYKATIVIEIQSGGSLDR